MNFTIVFQDKEGHQHEDFVEAPSASAALSLVLEKDRELGQHPDRITRVVREDR